MMSNPYEDPSVQVALTELRDASFLHKDSFSCGENFVFGQGKFLDETATLSLRSPIKRYTPGKPVSSGLTPPSETKTTVFTPRGVQMTS